MHIVFSQGHLSNARALAGGLLEVGVGNEVLEDRLRTLDIALTMTGGSGELAEILELAEKAPSLEKRQAFLQLAARWMVLHENDLGKLLDHLRARSTPPPTLFQNGPAVIAGVTRAIQAHLHAGGAPSSARPKRTKILMAAGDKDRGTADRAYQSLLKELGQAVENLKEGKQIRENRMVLERVFPQLKRRDRLTLIQTLDVLVNKEGIVGDYAVDYFDSIVNVLTPEEALFLVLSAEKKTKENSWKGVALLGKVTPRLELKHRLARAVFVTGKLNDPDKDLRGTAVVSLGKIIPSLDKPHIFAMALGLYPRIFDADENVYERAEEALSENFHLLEPGERLAIVSLIEAGLESPNSQERSQGAYALGLLIPQLDDPEDHWNHALVLKNKLGDESGNVAYNVIAALGRITPHLEPAERRLEMTLTLVRQLGYGPSDAWENILEYLEDILPRLDEEGKWKVLFEADTVLRRAEPNRAGLEEASILMRQILAQLGPNSEIRREAVLVLNRPAAFDDLEKEEAVAKLAYSYGNRLSYGAMRLLILKGMKVIRGEASDLIPVVDGAARGLIRESLGFGDQLEEMAEEWVTAEELLKEHPTMGGKLRRVRGLEGTRYGFPTSSELIKGEGEPLLLWPVRDPKHLTDTIWELLALSSHPAPQDFRLSLAVSGTVGDDLRPTALAVHALLPNPYVFVPELDINVLGWLAPVVEGGVGGPMGHVKMNGGGAEEDSDKPRRYDHLFMRFSYPPRASHLKPLVEEAPPEKKPWYRAAWDHLRGVRGVKKEKVDEWQKIFQGFIGRAQPEIIAVDAVKRAIHIKLYLDEGKANQTEMVWLVSEKDWAEMVNEVGDADGKSSLLRIGIIFDEFQKRFFLEMMRWVGRRELKTVVDAVWVLGSLREIARNEDAVTIPLAKSFTATKRRALQKLEAEFRSQFSQLLSQKGLKIILETPWVGNKDWGKIYADMMAYQKAMTEDSKWKKSIINLVEGVVDRAKEILQIP